MSLVIVIGTHTYSEKLWNNFDSLLYIFIRGCARNVSNARFSAFVLYVMFKPAHNDA